MAKKFKKKILGKVNITSLITGDSGLAYILEANVFKNDFYDFSFEYFFLSLTIASVKACFSRSFRSFLLLFYVMVFYNSSKRRGSTDLMMSDNRITQSDEIYRFYSLGFEAS